MPPSCYSSWGAVEGAIFVLAATLVNLSTAKKSIENKKKTYLVKLGDASAS
jgi:hypothetical protein